MTGCRTRTDVVRLSCNRIKIRQFYLAIYGCPVSVWLLVNHCGVENAVINILKRSFGYCIRQLGLNPKLMQLEPGDRCHLDKRQIRRIDRGHQTTSLITLCRLAAALNIFLPESVSELLTPPGQVLTGTSLAGGLVIACT